MRPKRGPMDSAMGALGATRSPGESAGATRGAVASASGAAPTIGLLQNPLSHAPT